MCSSPLQSLMLQIAANWIEQEKKDNEAAKAAYMAENCPLPDLSGDQATLMVRPILDKYLFCGEAGVRW